MREIKFRALDKKKKVMVGPFNLEELYLLVPGNDGDWKDLILMQYVGIKDKNGKELFEHDFIRVGKSKRIWRVEYLNTSFALSSIKWRSEIWNINNFPNFYKLDFEIVGNHWENPELLQ